MFPNTSKVMLTFLTILPVVLMLRPSAAYYTAAVYQHQTLGDISSDPPRHIIQRNLGVYTTVANTAAKQGADIIVFPEDGLFGGGFTSRQIARPFLENVPDPRRGSWNPCSHPDPHRPILTNLSCIAQSNNIVVVANMGDVQPCTRATDPHCPEDDVYQYNANVAFDRKGQLLVRYHKMHLFFEPAYNTPREKEFGIFKTDFGTFGTFTCFDIMFKEATELVSEKGIQNIAFPTWWFDEHPMLSAIQFHQAWAFRNGVNLLASNNHVPSMGSLGTAVYSGTQRILNATYDQPRLIITRVPSKPSAPSKGTTIFRSNSKTQGALSNPKLPPDYKYSEIVWDNCTFTKLTKASDNITACNNGMCCSLRYNATSLDEEHYLVVFNGTRDTRNTYFVGEEYCLLVRCDPKGGKKCSSFPMETETNFTYISLQANFTTSFVYPNFQARNMALEDPYTWSYFNIKSNASIEVIPRIPLISVYLYGRCYERDSKNLAP